MAVVEASDGHLYYGSSVYEEDLTLTKLDKNVTANFVLSTVSIPKQKDILYFSIYPNPAKGKSTNIQFFAPVRMAEVQITDMKGRMILSRSEHVINGMIQMPINNLKNGTYILSVNSAEFSQNQKLIIE